MHEGNHHVLRGKPTSEVLFALQSHEIRRIARHEECVFVGRCADYVLRGEDVRLLTVFVAAPDEHRIQRKMAQEKLTRDQAIRLIRKDGQAAPQVLRELHPQDLGHAGGV